MGGNGEGNRGERVMGGMVGPSKGPWFGSERRSGVS